MRKIGLAEQNSSGSVKKCRKIPILELLQRQRISLILHKLIREMESKWIVGVLEGI